jgi:outer membrane protein assembly factor BamD
MFKIKHLFILSITVLALTLAGCKSQFEKIRLSNDVAKKYKEAMRLYNKKDYAKALILFEDLSQKYRGREQAEELNYYYALTLYKIKDYTTARYQFKSFVDTYPTSRYAEECRYMYAYCFYLDSPASSLDQENTYRAIDALQLFINLYPKSERVVQATDYINKLRAKLETKAYENAKLYYDLGGYDLTNYKAAVIALQNAEIEFPDIKYAEEMNMLTVKAQYNYASNSIELRQEERYNEAVIFANDFIDKYPESKYLKEVQKLKADSEAGIKYAQTFISERNAEIEKYKASQQKTAKRDSLMTTTKTPIK